MSVCTIRGSIFLGLFLVLLMSGVGCKNHQDEKPGSVVDESHGAQEASVQSDAEMATDQVVLMQDPVLPLLVEEQVQVLPIWREYREQHPALMVFSSKMMQPVPAQLEVEVERLLTSGDELEIVRRSARPVADRLLDADMGVAAALSQGWISRVIWVVPLGDDEVMLPLAGFKAALRERVSGWGEEIETFHESGTGSYVGSLSGVPVQVLPVSMLPKIEEPFLMHIDAGYFGAMYRNEVKTPLGAIMKSTLGYVAQFDYSPLVVTVSRDTVNRELPLMLRFLAGSIAEVIAEPRKLDEPSGRMQLRREIQYLESFFQPQRIAEKAQELMRLAPRDGDAVYSYYLALRQAKQLDRALEVLAQVLELDPGYADTYIELVQHAAQKGQLEAALSMLDHVQTAQPDNPLIGLRKAEVLVEMGRAEEATVILQKLAQLPWSEVYYPRIRHDIEGLLKKAQNRK